MSATIVIAEPIHEDGIARLRQHYSVIEANGSPEIFADALKQATGCVVRARAVPAELIASAPKLRVISKHGAGVDAIDVDAASAHGIVVANTPGANSLSVAEASISLMFAVYRQTARQHRLVLDGNFAGKDSLTFHELTGKTLGLVGGGNIGRLIAGMCRNGFQMRVLLFDPYMTAAAAADMGAEKAGTLDLLLRTADIISVQAPLTDSTRGLIGKDQLALMPEHAILINVARGGIVDEAALTEALQNNRIAGAGLDCFDEEPTPTDNPLIHLPNVALSPHSGGASAEGLQRTAHAAADIIIDALNNRKPTGLINSDIWDKRRQLQ